MGVEKITGHRKWAHSNCKSSSRKAVITRAIRKHGWENCIFEYIAMDKDPEECYALEIKLIKEWKLQDRNFGYNMSSGGERGFSGIKMSQEHKNKISVAHKGKIVTPETREKLRQANLGKKLTKEHKLAITKSLIGKPGRNTGKKHTEITKKKISDSLKGEKIHFLEKSIPLKQKLRCLRKERESLSQKQQNLNCHFLGKGMVWVENFQRKLRQKYLPLKERKILRYDRKNFGN